MLALWKSSPNHVQIYAISMLVEVAPETLNYSENAPERGSKNNQQLRTNDVEKYDEELSVLEIDLSVPCPTVSSTWAPKLLAIP